MSTVGLTKAIERALDYAKRGRYDLIKRPTWVRLREAELVDRDGKLTPRGHAALAAPRMTQAEYDAICHMDKYRAFSRDEPVPYSSRQVRLVKRLEERGFVGNGTEYDFSWLTPVGRTALNNVRAAMGSPDWKEGL